MSVPALRFPEFDGDWQSTTLGSLCQIYDGTHQTPKYVPQGVPFYSVEHVTANQFSKTKFISEEVYIKENKRVRLEENDILMTRIGDIGTARLIDWDVSASFYVSLALIKKAENIVPRFLSNYISSEMFRRELWKRTIHVAFPRKINLGEIGRCKVATTSLTEQKKIAAFLGVVDDKLSALKSRRDFLGEYKRGLMQKLLSQELRFTKPNGQPFPDWEENRLGKVFNEVTDKVGTQKLPTFSISAGKGWVSQKEKFGKDISGKQNKKYTALSVDDFSYNKGNSKTYKFGCIYPNNTGQTIGVPNVFISFRAVDKDTSVGFYAKLFEGHYLDRGLRTLISSGARMDGLLNVNKGEFFKLFIPFPHPDEQQKIADAMSALDAKISAVSDQITALQDFKKGLLQQMFV